MKPFSVIKPSLQRDGALRDFYIKDTNSDDWDKLIQFVTPKLENGCYIVEGESKTIPRTFRSIEAVRSVKDVFLDIPVGDKYLRCHFFCEEIIKLDFWPYDFCDSNSWNKLSSFFQQVVNLIQKTGIVTFENDSETKDPVETFQPN